MLLMLVAVKIVQFYFLDTEYIFAVKSADLMYRFEEVFPQSIGTVFLAHSSGLCVERSSSWCICRTVSR